MDQTVRPPTKAYDRTFKINTTSIPNLTELRESLGYGHAGVAADIEFKRATAAHVKDFVSSENLRGVECLQWKTPAHQRGLREMTKDFLNAKAKGPEFWPDDPESSNKRPLKYRRDYGRIRRLLTQLFYRTVLEHKRKQSVASAANERAKELGDSFYRLKKSCAMTLEQADKMQSTIDAPARPAIRNVNSFAGSTFSLRAGFAMSPEDMPDGITTTDEPIDRIWEIKEDESNPQTKNLAPGNSAQATSAEDPYQVPNSPVMDTQVPQDRGKRPAEPYSIQDLRPAKTPRQGQDDRAAIAGPSSNSSSSNGLVTDGSSANMASTNLPSTSNSSSATSVPPQGSSSADRPSARPTKKRGYTRHEHTKTRTSTRPSKPIQRPGFAREQTIDVAVDNALHAPPSSSSSSEDEDEQDNSGAARPTASASNNTPRRENSSSTTPRRNATAPAERPLPQAHQTGSKTQASAKKSSMPAPKAPVPRPGSSMRREPVPQSSSTERTSAQQGSTNGSSTSGRATHQAQTSQPLTNPSPRRSIAPSAEEQQIIDASSFTYFRHDGTEFRSWTPSASVFHMTLPELVQDLAWAGGNDSQILCMRLETPEDPWRQDVGPGDDDKFNSVMRSFVKKMRRSYQGARMASAADPNLEFELHFWQQRQ